MTIWQASFTVVIWIACLSMLRPSILSKKSMLPQGVFLWTIAYTLTRAPIYDTVDRALGGHNITNLLYRVFMIAGIACLEVMLFRASGRRSRQVELTVAAVALLLSACQALLYKPTAWPISDTYLSAYGGQPSREAFWNLLPLCVAAFAIHVVVAVAPGWRRHSVLATRWGIALIAASSVSDVGWAVENLLSSVLRLFGDPHLLLGQGSDPLGDEILGISAICTGIGVIVASSEQPINQAWMRLLVLRLWPLWSRTVADRDAGSLLQEAAVSLFTIEPEHLLYGRWVEILDAQRASGSPLTPGEQDLLDLIETSFGASTSQQDHRTPHLFGGLLSSGR